MNDNIVLLQHLCDSIERLDGKIDQVQKDVSELKEREAEARGKKQTLITVGSAITAAVSAILANWPLILKWIGRMS